MENIGTEKREQMLQSVREIILSPMEKDLKNVKSEIHYLKQELTEEPHFYGRLNPYFEEKVKYLQAEFPTLFGPFLSTAVRVQLQSSKEDFVDAMYPILGLLVRKYINNEIQVLEKKIDDWFENITSFNYWKEVLSGMIFGKRETITPPSIIPDPELQEIFVMKNDGSGILLGQLSFNNLMDTDMVAAMFEAIMGFMEQAFRNPNQQLQEIAFDQYKILIYSALHFQIVFVLSGIPNHRYKNQLNDNLIEFISLVTINANTEADETVKSEVEMLLKNIFVRDKILK